MSLYFTICLFITLLAPNLTIVPWFDLKNAFEACNMIEVQFI